MSNLPSNIDQRFERLMARYCNNELTDADRRELSDLVQSSAPLRSAYWDWVSIDAGLRWIHGGKRECDSRLAQLEEDLIACGDFPAAADQEEPRRGAGLLTRAARWAFALAASVLLALSVSRDYWIDAGGKQDSAARTSNSLDTPDAGVMGTLTSLSTDSHWSSGSFGEVSRQLLLRGETLWLNRGAAVLRLASGVVAQLEAPLILEMTSLDCARVLRGRITVDVPEGAEGFRVETAAAEVIDLGTTFSVDVADSGDTDVVVFQGVVDVRPALSEGTAENDAGAKQRLLTGEALRVAEDGTLSRIVNVWRAKFSEKQERAPLIKEVRDNVVRGQTRKYYEIVPGGMREEAEAFVDRSYQWNGVDKQGIPGYLVGGDYVKTFNDDKVIEDLQITVSLDRPATIYILVDDRLEQTDWLLDQFEDTDDNIGVDEGPRLPNDHRVFAEGPGASIDQTHSIWRQRKSGSLSIVIGPSGPVSKKFGRDGVKAKLSMYGIVAVPTETESAAL